MRVTFDSSFEGYIGQVNTLLYPHIKIESVYKFPFGVAHINFKQLKKF